MKRLLMAAAVAAATVTTMVFAADVGDPPDNGKPGIYNRYIIGAYPRPELIYLIYRQPRVMEGMPINRPPIYLRVPSAQAKHWGRHYCSSTAPVANWSALCRSTGVIASRFRITTTSS